MRWENVEPVPEFKNALLAVGLPIEKCVQQTHPPHHVRTVYTRKLNHRERELATRTKAAVKAGKFDAAKELRWFDKPRAKPIADDLVALGLIDDGDALEPAPALLQPKAPTAPPQYPAPALRTPPGVPVKAKREADPFEETAIRNLGLEVIRTAWRDATSTSKSKAVLNPHTREKRDAQSFLTASSGEWAQSRAYWCAIADLCPDAVRDRALEQLI